MNFNKISIIIKREFSTRVKKKSFIVMSILGPFLFAAVILLPLWFATMEDKEVKTIAVVDSSYIITNKIPNTQTLKFEYIENVEFKDMKKTFKQRGYWGVLFISPIITYSQGGVELISYSQPPFSMKSHIENAISKEVEKQKLLAHNIKNLDEILKSVKTSISLRTIKLEEDGKAKESHAGPTMILSYACGFLIYMFIFIFGTQVMRGVIEEKTNRIIEVIISSVKPFELMMGKIIGIAAVGLLQFLIWIALTTSILTIAQQSIMPNADKSLTEKALAQDIMNKQMVVSNDKAITTPIPVDDKTAKMNEVYKALGQINFTLILSIFLFYFLGGYLLYASLFAAVGSAVDSDTDTQQFMLPITIPLILAIYVMINTMNNPDSSLSWWFSMIPLTSPVVMMARIPFGVPVTDLILSASLLILAFIATTWLAAKIYRTGILMYGKKPSYAEIWKWIRLK